MLSFMKDGGSENNSQGSNIKKDAGSAQAGQNNPISAQNLLMGNQDFITVAPADKSAKKSTITLVIIFVIGIAGLFFMIKKSGPSSAIASTADAEKSRIEQAIANLTGIKTEITKGLEKVMQKFHSLTNVEKVKLAELSKNPFMVDPYLNEGLSTVKGESTTNVQASKLELFSIMQSGKRMCCMVNDKILYEGDEVTDYIITKITEKTVVLRPKSNLINSEEELILKLSE